MPTARPSPLDRLRRSRRARTGSRWPYPVVRDAPPAAPPGCEAAPPDFVGVGVQKAGTTWWFGLIAGHPEVHQPSERPKELHYFDAFRDRPMGAPAIEEYHHWFARPQGTRAGEWTPRYLYDWWVPPLLARAAPDARVLVMLRDPIDRYRSQLARDRDRGAPDAAIVHQDAFHRGLYGAQLARLARSVPSERIIVLQYERCRADPVGELARTFEALDLDPSHRPADATRHVGPRLEPPRLDEAVVADLRLAFRDDLDRLFADHPGLDPALWPTASECS